jgi:uncharacterized damage-inducible protein DinB
VLKSIERQFEKLEAQRTELLSAVAGASEGALTSKPDGKWSVLEILTHIVTAEQLSQAYLKKKMQGIESLPEAGLSSWLRSGLLTVSQRLPLRYKAPRRVVENTPEGLPLAEIKNRWDASRQEYRELLGRITETTVNKAVYKHPRAGYMNVLQMITFYRDHIVHHRPQIISRLKQVPNT